MTQWRPLTRILSLGALLVALTFALNGTAYAHGPHLATYRVTLKNLTNGQPFSPPVAATHLKAVRMFQVGHLASDELAAIALDGNEAPMAARLMNSGKATQVVDVGMPLTPMGKVVGSFSDTISFEIKAAPGDRFSLATMLICTNDGFLGLDAVRLPQSGTDTHYLNGYDAGRENNTERSMDIVDPCSALGPFALAGDPNGNRDSQVATMPPQVIQMHPGIMGTGELSVAQHGWHNPVAVVMIERID